MFHITKITDAHRPFLETQIAGSWEGPFVVSRGVLHDTRLMPGFAAIEDGVVTGYAMYNITDGDCELTVIESITPGRGVGSALINEVLGAAKEAGCRRLWLVTTNDNTHAIRFYQRYGFSLKAVHIGAIAEARKLKPQIPLLGDDDIPSEHELEFEIVLLP